MGKRVENQRVGSAKQRIPSAKPSKNMAIINDHLAKINQLLNNEISQEENLDFLNQDLTSDLGSK